MKDSQELQVQEKKFFETNVEGNWKHEELTCSDTLLCSDYLFCC